METGIPALENMSDDSMLTYAVLFGRQARRNDPYALGAQITDLAVRGHLSIHESEHDIHNPVLHIGPDTGLLKEEEVFMQLLRQNCPPDNDNRVTLGAIINSEHFTAGVKVLWQRVVMMHHVDHNQDRPLYEADPTQLNKWMQFKRMTSWLRAIGSVYADPGWQGPVGGLAEVQKGHEPEELLGATKYGRALRHKITAIQKQMLQLVASGNADAENIKAYERALPFAFLFDNDLREKWPIFLSQRYAEYPSWFEPAEPAEDKASRQAQIAATLGVMGTLCFPVRKRRARRA